MMTRNTLNSHTKSLDLSLSTLTLDEHAHQQNHARNAIQPNQTHDPTLTAPVTSAPSVLAAPPSANSDASLPRPEPQYGARARGCVYPDYYRPDPDYYRSASESLRSAPSASHRVKLLERELEIERRIALAEARTRNPLPDSDAEMADVEAPVEHHRYRGGRRDNRNGGGRKRRFDQYDEHDDQRYQPRRRFEEPLSRVVRRQILEVADSPMRDAREEVAAIAKVIVDNDRDEKFCSIITDLLPQVVVEQPLKIPFVAAILLYANEEKPSIVGDVLDKATTALQTALDAGEWRSVKLLLRLFACVHSFFDGDGVFGILDELFNRAVDLQTASSEDALGPRLVKIIMLTIPFILASPAEGVQERAMELLEKTDIVASAPMTGENTVLPYVTAGEDGALAIQSPIKLLQAQLQGEAANGWPLVVIPRLFKPKSQGAEDGDGSATNKKHRFPTVTVPQVVKQQEKTLFPEVYFSLYADQEVETVPATTNIAASLFRDALADTINLLEFNRNEAARFLLQADAYWAPNMFAPRGIPLDQLKEQQGSGRPTWKREDLAIDAIFSQLFQLPTPEHKAICYHAMITQACKIAPGDVAPSLGRAIRFVYKNLSAFDIELGYRFTDWFAHHLSNFDFRWKWAEWTNEVSHADISPHKAFILGLLDKEIRLSFAKRIRDTLPPDYHPLIPSTRENDIPEFKYKADSVPYAAEAKAIIEHLKKKSPIEDMQPTLDAITSAELAAGKPAAEAPLAAVDVLMTSICHIGSKSLSHLLQYIERYRTALAALAASVPGAQAANVAAVVNHWRAVQPGVAVNTISKLLNYAVVSPASVLEWLVAPATLDSGRFLAETWPFEMVSMTLSKVSLRLHQILDARSSTNLAPDAASSIETALAAEQASIRALFALIENALNALSTPSPLTAGLTPDEGALVKVWAAKWLRATRRWMHVEEARVGEAVKAFPPPKVAGPGEDGAGEGGPGEDVANEGGAEVEMGNAENGVGDGDGAMES